MSNINFVGFGGLNEKGKQCYALSVDNDIYLFNCGILTPPNSQLGIRKIIPDFSWIIKNASKIKGLFIGTPQYENYAGLPFLLKNIPNLPIYVSDVGAVVINNYFSYLDILDKVNFKPNVRIIDPLKSFKLGECFITPFNISNFSPKSLGFIINTRNGAVIFIDDFMINSNRNLAFDNQMPYINRITKGNNLLLITGVGNVGINKGFTSPSHSTLDFLTDTISTCNNGRILIACNEFDMYTVMTIASVCAHKKRPFIIYSGSINKEFDCLIKKGYFVNHKLKTIRKEQMQTTNDAVIVLTGIHQRLISKIHAIINDEDPLIKILPSDYFVYATHQVNGYEKLEAKMFDDIVCSNVQKVIKLPKEIITATASAEDHKFLIDLIRPKYVIPINGLYMNFVQYQEAISKSYIKNENIIKLGNGDVAWINDGNLNPKNKYIKQQLQFVNSNGSVDPGSTTIFERKQMTSDGAIIVNLFIDKNNKKILLSNFEPIGVVNLTNENQEIIKQINTNCIELINEYLEKNITDVSKPINTKDFKYYIKKIFTKNYEKKFEKKPLIISALVFKNKK